MLTKRQEFDHKSKHKCCQESFNVNIRVNTNANNSQYEMKNVNTNADNTVTI